MKLYLLTALILNHSTWRACWHQIYRGCKVTRQGTSIARKPENFKMPGNWRCVSIRIPMLQVLNY